MAQLAPVYTGIYPDDDTLLQWAANQRLTNEMLLPPLIGWSMNLMLTGAIVILFAQYLVGHVYHSDVRWFKAFTWLVLLVDFLLAALSFDSILFYGRTQHRDTLTLLVSRDLDAAIPVVSGLLGTLVQSYLARRAARLLYSRHKLVAIGFLAVIIPCAILSFLSSLGTTILFFFANRNELDVAGPLSYTVLQGTWLWLSAGIDCFITIGLFAALRSGSKGFNPETDSLIRFYIVLAAETALYTSVTAICGASMSVAWPTANNSTVNLPYIFSCPIPSLYTLSFLVNLWARKGEAAGLTKFAAHHTASRASKHSHSAAVHDRLTAATIFLPRNTKRDSHMSGIAEKISVSRSQMVSIDQ